MACCVYSWVAAAHLLKKVEGRYASLLTALPAAFMSAVSMACIIIAKEGFGLSSAIAYPVGIIFAAGCVKMFKKEKLS